MAIEVKPLNTYIMTDYRVICDGDLLFLMNNGYHIDWIIDTKAEKVYNTSKMKNISNPKPLKVNEDR